MTIICKDNICIVHVLMKAVPFNITKNLISIKIIQEESDNSAFGSFQNKQRLVKRIDKYTTLVALLKIITYVKHTVHSYTLYNS